MFVITFVVETRGRTLEETAALFDGEQPQQDLVQRGGEAATMDMNRANAFKDGNAASLMELHPVSVLVSSDRDDASDPDPQTKDDKSLEHPYYVEAV